VVVDRLLRYMLLSELRVWVWVTCKQPSVYVNVEPHVLIWILRAAAAAAVMVLLQSAPNLVRPKLVQLQLAPALTAVACLRGPDLAGLPPCPQPFIDR
jgi:hypothetical protein